MRGEKRVTFKVAGGSVLALIVTGFIIEKMGGIPKILSDFSRSSIIYKINLLIAVGAVAAGLYKIRKFIVKVLISPAFAVALLISIALFTITGTLILQNESYENYLKVYNSKAVDIFYKFHLTDIFHTYYFGILLFTLAVSLILVIAKRKPFKLTQLGFTLTHGGTVLILIGGLIGLIYGEKGFLHLIKGEKPTNKMRILKNGREAGSKTLDFAVSLDDFKVEYYEQGERISVYQKEKDGYRYLFSVDPEKTKEFQLPGGIRTIRILNKNIYESVEEKIKIPYFEIEVERPKNSKVSVQVDKNSPHHGMTMGNFSGPVQLVLAPGNPLPFDNNRYIVAYENKKEPKLFQSVLSIYENNEKKITAPIVVNSPLTYKSYKFYQSNYNPENPDYSGILVVKDPGLTLVYLGFIMICAGIIYIFYIKPKIVEKLKKAHTNLEKATPLSIST